MFTAAENVACRRLVELALEEDLGSSGDVTSQVLIPAGAAGRAVLIARAAGVLAGLPAGAMVFGLVDPQIHVEPLLQDGCTVEAGSRIARVAGLVRGLLGGERVALNV